MLNIDRVRGAKEDQIVGRREKVDTAYHVLAHTRIVVLVDKLCNLADDFHFLEQIYRVGFGIMAQEEGRALLGQVAQVLYRAGQFILLFRLCLLSVLYSCCNDIS